jgi:hypothetical protein
MWVYMDVLYDWFNVAIILTTFASQLEGFFLPPPPPGTFICRLGFWNFVYVFRILLISDALIIFKFNKFQDVETLTISRGLIMCVLMFVPCGPMYLEITALQGLMMPWTTQIRRQHRSIKCNIVLHFLHFPLFPLFFLFPLGCNFELKDGGESIYRVYTQHTL